VLFDKDAKRLAVLGLDDLHVAELPSGGSLRKVADGAPQYQRPNWASASRSHVVLRAQGGVEIWDVARETRVLALPDQYWSLSVSPDGKRAAGIDGDRGVRLWQLASPTAPPSRLDFSSDAGAKIWFSADGQQLLLESENKLEVRDLSGKLLRERKVTDSELAAISRDGKWLAWRSRFQTILGHTSDLSRRAVLWSVVSEHGAFASAPSGEIEVFEHPASHHLGCRIGPVNHPFHLCQERYEVEGMLRKLLRGDQSYRQP
jgi:WD40 repeat protein